MSGTEVCALCVQWRCKSCKSPDWPNCCDDDWSFGSEPYWPDGTVAEVTQDDYCDTCYRTFEEYESNKGDW